MSEELDIQFKEIRQEAPSLGDIRSVFPTKGRNWQLAKPMIVKFNSDNGYPTIWDDDGEFTPQSPDEILEYIINNVDLVTYAPLKELHSLFKLFSSQFCYDLALYKEKIEYNGYSISCFTPNKITVMTKSGNSKYTGGRWGRIVNISRFVELENPTPKIIKETMLEFLDTIYEGLGDIKLNSLHSPAGVMQDYIMQIAGFAFPTLSKEPIKQTHLQRALNCFKGGRMEANYIGTIKKAYQYDFNSFYPSIIATLPSCNPKYMNWIESNEYQSSAFYGFCLCNVNIPFMPLSPLPFRMIRRLLFPCGNYTAWLTKQEIDLITSICGKDVITIIEGSWGIPTINNTIFKTAMYKINQLRRNSKFSKLFKLMSVSGYGKMAGIYYTPDKKTGEVKTSTSPLYNPIYASTITSIGRVKLYTLQAQISPNGNGIASLTVDGIVSLRELPDLEDSLYMGEPRLVKEPGEVTLITDYCKDRDKDGFWRRLVETTGRDNVFTLNSHSRHGLGSFLIEDKNEAHKNLGKEFELYQDLKIGSCVRLNIPMNCNDILRNEYPTIALQEKDLVYNMPSGNIPFSFDGFEGGDLRW